MWFVGKPGLDLFGHLGEGLEDSTIWGLEMWQAGNYFTCLRRIAKTVNTTSKGQ